MAFFRSQSIWKVQHMLCYLSYIFKDLSCFLEEKAIGPMPPHREAIHGFARSIGNMSTLLILASLELKQAALQLQPSLAQRQMVDSAMPHGGIDDLCQASWCDLFDIWACIKPLFGTLQADLTFWSRYKKGRGSPPDADYKTMAEALSYAVFAVRSFAKIETALVWYLFNGTSYVSLDYYTSIGVSLTRAFSFMKLGREMTSREVVERQIYPIYYHNPKPVGIVLPFRSPYDIETVGNVMPREKLRIWYEYPEDCPFRYLYYNAMESARYIEHRKLLTSTNNPELCSRSVSRPVQMRQMLWRSKASRLIKDRDIWIGQERTSRYDQFTEAATLRGVISVSLGHKRTKKMLVSLHPTYLLLFRERGVSLVLRDEIPRANILLVTHDFQGPPRYEVGVCWKSASTEPTSMAYMKLVFDDSTEAKVWASCLAPKDLPYELIAECLEGDFVPKHSNIDGEFSGTRLAGPQAPPAESFLQDLTMNQVQRLLFRVKNQDLDLLHYRIFTIPRGLEAVVIQDPHTEASYAAIDIVVDDTPSSLEVNRLPSGDTEETSDAFQYYFLNKSNWYEYNIVEYLEACHGSWHLAEGQSHKTCYVEVPNGATIENTFRGAINRLIYGFLCATTNTHHDKFDKVEKRLDSNKLMVYSRESLSELELWVREAVTRFQSAEYLGLN